MRMRPGGQRRREQTENQHDRQQAQNRETQSREARRRPQVMRDRTHGALYNPSMASGPTARSVAAHVATGGEVLPWPDGGMTTFKATKETAYEGASASRPPSAGPARSNPVRSRPGSCQESRFALAQQDVATLAATAIDFPPMQAQASFNLDTVKKEIDEKIRSCEGQ